MLGAEHVAKPNEPSKGWYLCTNQVSIEPAKYTLPNIRIIWNNTSSVVS